MRDSFMPPGWYLDPQSWPYWMPSTFRSSALVLPRALPDQITPQLTQPTEYLSSDPPVKQFSAAHELIPPSSLPSWLGSAPLSIGDAAATTNEPVRQPSTDFNSFGARPSQKSQDAANFDPADFAPIATDATEDAWLPGQHYAQMGGRRGGRRVGRRELSPLEEIHSILYDNALRALRELDPRHPELQWWQPEGWIPRQEHVNRLNWEIARTVARIKAKGGLSDLEPHHTLPNQFNEQHFYRLGIDNNYFILYMPRDLHRLKPDGLHTGPEHWNNIWEQFFEKYPRARQQQVFEQLLKMLKERLD